MNRVTEFPMVGEYMPLALRVEFIRRVLSPRPTARRRQLKTFARALVGGR